MYMSIGTVTTYKSLGVDLSNICNTVNHSYYGDITTKFSQIGADIGTILSLNTFSPVSGTITPCNYNANITQYNTGASWTPVTLFGNLSGVSMSSSGQYAIACIYGGLIYRSVNYGVTWLTASS
jgi:hypothetical protein